MRRVSGLERVWLAAERIHAPFAITIELERVFEPAPLERAVAACSTAHPGARVTVRGGRWVVGEAPIPLRTGPVDPDAPLAVACEVVHAPGSVAIRCRHAAMDGRALWGFVEDLCRALDGEAPLGAEAGPTMDIDLARRATRRAARQPPGDATWVLDESDGAGPVRLVRRGAVPSPVLRTLADRLFARGASRVGVPVDLRRLDPDLRSDANLTGVVHIAPGQAIDPERAAEHVVAAHAVRWVPVAWMAALGRRAPGPAVSATVSHLGRRPLSVGGSPVPAVFHPPYSPGMPLFLGVVGDAETLAVAAVAPGGRAGGLERLLDGLLAP